MTRVLEALVALEGDPVFIPRTHIVTHNQAELHFQGIQLYLLTSLDTLCMSYAGTHARKNIQIHTILTRFRLKINKIKQIFFKIQYLQPGFLYHHSEIQKFEFYHKAQHSRL